MDEKTNISSNLSAIKSKSVENLPMCPDWIASATSNVHIAKDRGWFITYQPLESFVQCNSTENTMKVEGIGTVLLQTFGFPDISGLESHGRIRLIHVLHIPSAFCNIIRTPINADSAVSFEPVGNYKGSLSDKTGTIVAQFKKDHPMFALKLRDHPVGPSVFGTDDHSPVDMVWPQSEIEKYLGQRRLPPNIGEPPYNKEEKEWFKTRHGGEHNFLRRYALSIHRDDERDEGRTIARALMKMTKRA